MADASPQSEADATSTPQGKNLQRTMAYLTEMREGMVERQRAKTRAATAGVRFAFFASAVCASSGLSPTILEGRGLKFVVA